MVPNMKRCTSIAWLNAHTAAHGTHTHPQDAATLLDELTEAVNTVVHLEQSFDKVVEAAMSYDPSSEDGKGDGSGDVDGDDVKTLLGDKSAPKPLAQAPAAEDTSWGLAIASNLERFDSLIEVRAAAHSTLLLRGR